MPFGTSGTPITPTKKALQLQPRAEFKHMRRVILAMTILLMMALEVPSASGQNCPDFNKAIETTMVSNHDMDAQLARIKAMAKLPSSDVGVCNAAKQLRDQAAAAAKLANQSCGPETDQIVGGLGDMAQSAETDINLFCNREVYTQRPVRPSANLDAGFIFSDSDRRRLTVGELRGLSPEQLRIARNEIYARRGRYFKDEALKAYFSQFPWYQPDQRDVTLNDVEQANVRLIQSMGR